jgi:hypothetical protein
LCQAPAPSAAASVSLSARGEYKSPAQRIHFANTTPPTFALTAVLSHTNYYKMASSVMDRPEEDRMHHVARRAAPDAVAKLEEHLAKPENMIVAIERHNCDWRDGSKPTEARFLWLKANEVSEFALTHGSVRFFDAPLGR